MEISEFIKDFASQLDETDPESLTPETIFREIEEWSSMTMLSIIAMSDEVYHVRLKGEDILKAVTIRDIFDTVQSRLL